MSGKGRVGLLHLLFEREGSLVRIEPLQAVEHTSIGAAIRDIGSGAKFIARTPVLRSFNLVRVPVLLAFGLQNVLLLPFALRALHEIFGATPAELVAWRLGMAHYAPFLRSLDPAGRTAARRAAERAVAASIDGTTGGGICTYGLFCLAVPGSNRSLADVFEVHLDPAGGAKAGSGSTVKTSRPAWRR